jgi:hypothetical protein
LATNHTMYRGDRFEKPSIEFSGSLSGATVRMTVKRRKSAPDSDALFQITSAAPNANGEITFPDATHAAIVIYPAATVNARPGRYYYDVEVTFSALDVSTADTGEFNILEEVTRTPL